jgi:hypothetical protein
MNTTLQPDCFYEIRGVDNGARYIIVGMIIHDGECVSLC